MLERVSFLGVIGYMNILLANRGGKIDMVNIYYWERNWLRIAYGRKNNC